LAKLFVLILKKSYCVQNSKHRPTSLENKQVACEGTWKSHSKINADLCYEANSCMPSLTRGASSFEQDLVFIYFFFVSVEEASQRFTSYRTYSTVSNHLHAAF